MPSVNRAAMSILALSLIWVCPAGPAAGDERPVGSGDFRPLFGTPEWTIHQGRNGSWGFYDDGTIFARRGGGGWLMTRKEYGDFELRLEIKMAKNGDTGITFRSSLDVDANSRSINQIQFADEDLARAKNWPGYWRTGGVFDVVGPQKEGATKPVGEWNKVHIIARGSRLKVTINGTLTLDVDLQDFKDRVAANDAGRSPHPDLLRPKGHIGLQAWDGQIEFRNVEIKELN